MRHLELMLAGIGVLVGALGLLGEYENQALAAVLLGSRACF